MKANVLAMGKSRIFRQVWSSYPWRILGDIGLVR